MVPLIDTVEELGLVREEVEQVMAEVEAGPAPASCRSAR
ncbi:hypothetical protein STENM223S_06344 [Streptomyces tendae]